MRLVRGEEHLSPHIGTANHWVSEPWHRLFWDLTGGQGMCSHPTRIHPLDFHTQHTGLNSVFQRHSFRVDLSRISGGKESWANANLSGHILMTTYYDRKWDKWTGFLSLFFFSLYFFRVSNFTCNLRGLLVGLCFCAGVKRKAWMCTWKHL